MTLDLTVEDDRWLGMDLAGIAQRAMVATLTRAGLKPEECEVSLLACDDRRIALLNAEFREKPQPTNVLSWPAEDLAAETDGGQPAAPVADFTGETALGDIAIAWDTCQREAEVAAKPVADHVTHLLVHGILHLLGYDHIRDADATLMEATEVEILGNLGIDNPYRDMDRP